MPSINKTFTLEVRPEQFLEACSALELKEIEMLIQSQRFQNKILHATATADGGGHLHIDTRKYIEDM